MTGKREAPVNKVSRSQGWCFNHSEMVLVPCWSLSSLLFLQERQQPGERRDQNVPQQSSDLSGNRRPSYRYPTVFTHLQASVSNVSSGR